MCTCSTNSGSKPELTKKIDDQHHGANKAESEWFGLVKTNPVTLNLFISHHGTGPRTASTSPCGETRVHGFIPFQAFDVQENIGKNA